MPSCAALFATLILTAVLVHAVGWTGMFILAVVAGLPGPLFRLLFGATRRP